MVISSIIHIYVYIYYTCNTVIILILILNLIFHLSLYFILYISCSDDNTVVILFFQNGYFSDIKEKFLIPFNEPIKAISLDYFLTRDRSIIVGN
jgi:hypothetical protein